MTANHLDKNKLDWLFRTLNSAYGDLDWWPAETRIEMLIGAVLVQNTAWTNAEKAIANLRARDWLNAESIHALPQSELASAIRPAGYFNIKARRLQALCAWVIQQGGLVTLDEWTTKELREGLLCVHGVGPETADCILVYAFNRPVFVVDAYTQRLLQRLGWQEGVLDYESLRAVFESTQPQDAGHLGQYHALIVEHAKQYCRAKPSCSGCPLARGCEYTARPC